MCAIAQRLDKQDVCRKKDKSKESYYDSIQRTATTHSLQKKRDPRTECTRNSSHFISQCDLTKGLTNTSKIKMIARSPSTAE